MTERAGFKARVRTLARTEGIAYTAARRIVEARAEPSVSFPASPCSRSDCRSRCCAVPRPRPELVRGARVRWAAATTGKPTDGWTIRIRLCSADREWLILDHREPRTGPVVVHLDDCALASGAT